MLDTNSGHCRRALLLCGSVAVLACSGGSEPAATSAPQSQASPAAEAPQVAPVATKPEGAASDTAARRAPTPAGSSSSAAATSGAGGATAGSAAVAGRLAQPAATLAGMPGAGSAGSTVQPTAAGSGIQAGAGGGPDLHLPAACSGCPQDSTDKTDLSVHLHHVHVNVADRERSAQFYEKQLGAQRVLLNGTEEALHSSPMWLLLDVKPMPASRLPTALQHIGWGSMDTKAWYDAAHAQGVAPDTRGGLTVFTTNDTPMVGDVGTGSSVATLLGVTAPACLPVVDPFAYMYVLGPDAERIEVCSGADERVHHLHFTTPDLVTTSRWYARFLGAGNANASPILIYAFYLDDILLVWEEVGQASDYKPTDDHVLSHVAFSVADLEVWLKRAKDQNIEIVAEPADAHGFRSFFVRGPDGMLIELVQAAASKELCLNNASSLPPPSIPRAMP